MAPTTRLGIVAAGPDQRSSWCVIFSAMKGLAGGLLISVACSATLVGQERDRSFERISLRLQQAPPVLGVVNPVEGAAPKRIGIFTLVPPTAPGEMVRVSVPIGELVSRAFKGAAAANRRRQESAVRRRVAADLEWFKAQPPSPKP